MLKYIIVFVLMLAFIFLLAYMDALAYEQYVKDCELNHEKPLSYERWAWEKGKKYD